jgi:ankyrin repeat protein
MVKALVEAGADADAADNDGTTPLMMAAECGHLAVVQVSTHVHVLT